MMIRTHHKNLLNYVMTTIIKIISNNNKVEIFVNRINRSSFDEMSAEKAIVHKLIVSLYFL